MWPFKKKIVEELREKYEEHCYACPWWFPPSSVLREVVIAKRCLEDVIGEPIDYKGSYFVVRGFDNCANLHLNLFFGVQRVLTKYALITESPHVRIQSRESIVNEISNILDVFAPDKNTQETKDSIYNSLLPLIESVEEDIEQKEQN